MTFPIRGGFAEFHYEDCNHFMSITQDYDHVLINMPKYGSGHVREDALMMCHGIWFDHNNYPGASYRTPRWYAELQRCFASPAQVVSVDTNSVNYIRAVWPDLAQKMRFIPNFFDGKAFFPQAELRDPARLTVLFPRRSHVNRGSRILGEILRRIPHNVRIQWVGEGDAQDTQIILDLAKDDPHLTYHAVDFDDMPPWYQGADIAVIPTIACEGTSLSCIEAMACGCAVVSTNVGGLSNIVLTDFNGVLVEPTAAAIAAGINRLIENPDQRRRLQQNGLESIAGYELTHWRQRWCEVLLEQGWVDPKAIARARIAGPAAAVDCAPARVRSPSASDWEKSASASSRRMPFTAASRR